MKGVTPAARLRVDDANARLVKLQERTNVAVWVRVLKKLPDDKVQELTKVGGARQARIFQGFALQELSLPDGKVGKLHG